MPKKETNALIKFSGQSLSAVPLGAIRRQYAALARAWADAGLATRATDAAAGRVLLSLHTNALRTLPVELGELRAVRELLLHSNQLRAGGVPRGALGGLVALRTLSLNHNRLERVPGAVLLCGTLERLYLSANRLRTVPPALARRLPRLRVLTLAQNRLGGLPRSVARLTQLEELNVAGNRTLLRLPRALGRCTALRTLSASYTPLAALPASLHHLTRLETLTLDGCDALATPPPAVVARGPKAVRKHLRRRAAVAERCLRVKLLLVGRENVGKSSLARALARVGVAHVDGVGANGGGGDDDDAERSAPAAARDDSETASPLLTRRPSGAAAASPVVMHKRRLFGGGGAKAARNLSTDGIATASVAFDYVPASASERVERGALHVAIWDFAGQELYGATHQFFVSPRSIFVVCFDLRSAEQDDAIERWLETIASRAGPDAPVLLVGTHFDDPQMTDVRTDAALDYLWDKFNKRFPNIVAYAPVSTTTLLGVREVRAEIEAAAGRQRFVGRPLPDAVVALDDALVHLRQTRLPPVMQWAEWCRLAAQCGLGGDPGLALVRREALALHQSQRHSTLDMSAAMLFGAHSSLRYDTEAIIDELDDDDVVVAGDGNGDDDDDDDDDSAGGGAGDDNDELPQSERMDNDNASVRSVASNRSFAGRDLDAAVIAEQNRAILAESEAEIRESTELLHALGSLLYFDDRRVGLDDVVVLHPMWMANAFASIVTTKANFVVDGILRATALGQIWRAPHFPPALHDDLLALLEKFELLHRVRTDAHLTWLSPASAASDDRRGTLSLEASRPNSARGTGALVRAPSAAGGDPDAKPGDAARYLVPLLLPPLPPGALLRMEQHVRASVGRHWHFMSFVPDGFFSRLLTRVARAALVDAFYSNGFLVRFRAEGQAVQQPASDGDGDGETRGVALFDTTERQLRIETGGPRAAALLSVLIDLVDALATNWFQVELDAYAPCPHCLAARGRNACAPRPFLFRHDEVLRAAAANRTTMMCRGETEVQLAAIAPDITLSELGARRIDLHELRLLGELARGGFGVVHKAQWRGEFVAVKLLNDDAAGGLAAFEEFRKEVQFMIGLRHTNIVCLLAFATEPRSLIMELIGGGDLYTFLQKPAVEAPLGEPLRLKIAWDMAAGMRYLHGVQPPLIHRDLKSPNVLLAAADAEAAIVAKVTDFGLSARAFGAELRDGEARAVDNPTWLAPEVLAGKPYSEASDVYAYGIIVWELLTRQHPWEAEAFQFMYQLENAVQQGRRPVFPSDAEPLLAELARRSWAPAAIERPAFDELCDALSRLAELRTPQIHTGRKRGTRRRRARTALRMGGLLAGTTDGGGGDAAGDAAGAAAATAVSGADGAESDDGDESDDIGEPVPDDALLPERVLFLNRATLAPPGRVLKLLVVPEAGHVWCASDTGHVSVFEAVAPGRLLHSFRAHSGAVVDMTLVRGSVWSASVDGSVRVWQCVDRSGGGADTLARGGGGGSDQTQSGEIDEQPVAAGAALIDRVHAQAQRALTEPTWLDDDDESLASVSERSVLDSDKLDDSAFGEVGDASAASTPAPAAAAAGGACFVSVRIECKGELMCAERRRMRGGWKRRRCVLRDDGNGVNTLLVLKDTGRIKHAVRIIDRTAVLTGERAQAHAASELRNRPFAFVLVRGDARRRVLLLDALGQNEHDRWVRQLDEAVVRARRRAQLTLLEHAIALPDNGSAVSLAVVGSTGGGAAAAAADADGRRCMVWVATDRPAAVHWIDAVQGTVLCTLSRASLFPNGLTQRGRTGDPFANAAPCAGPMLAVPASDSVWLAAPDGSIGMCAARTGRCRARLLGHRGVVQTMVHVFDTEVWSGARDASIRVWRAVDGLPLAALECDRSVHALVWCGRYVWSTGADASLTLWSAAERLPMLHLPPRNSDVVDTLAAVGARAVWSASWDGTVALWTGPAHDFAFRPAATAGAPARGAAATGSVVPLEADTALLLDDAPPSATATTVDVFDERRSLVLNVVDTTVRTSAVHTAAHAGRANRQIPLAASAAPDVGGGSGGGSPSVGARRPLQRTARRKNVFRAGSRVLTSAAVRRSASSAALATDSITAAALERAADAATAAVNSGGAQQAEPPAAAVGARTASATTAPRLQPFQTVTQSTASSASSASVHSTTSEASVASVTDFVPLIADDAHADSAAATNADDSFGDLPPLPAPPTDTTDDDNWRASAALSGGKPPCALVADVDQQ